MKFYAVRRGRRRGVYETWAEAQEQVALYPGAEHRSFRTRAQAEAYLGRHVDDEADALPYVEVHDGGRTTVVALTDEVRAALREAGVAIASE
ncbi:RNase H1/viroplasmin domain-containing protein [Rubrivirga marina]|uniref:Ribonuclease H n=1 Tax=Rubrivirga marina TaxID=1196024 RepID=A0A271IW91_9BACT|nr:RNase H1/viroplasmin domain-containing protein [Rubrivirga marina]PAP75074.1 hypothetical protein BSZ37_00715 [Rubrivirga marina]